MPDRKWMWGAGRCGVIGCDTVVAIAKAIDAAAGLMPELVSGGGKVEVVWPVSARGKAY
ncbi:MAG: hypothetical protein JJU08_04470 [Rhodobacteraceae bacterium]|nr:hypothetical protein [Paracoccaceae bacterium]